MKEKEYRSRIVHEDTNVSLYKVTLPKQAPQMSEGIITFIRDTNLGKHFFGKTRFVNTNWKTRELIYRGGNKNRKTMRKIAKES